MSINQFIEKINNNENLSFEESKNTFLEIMSGKISEDLIFQFLTCLAKKGESADEIAGGVYILRKKALNVNVPENTIDTCGTGGDGKNTLNISTASSIVLSSLNVKVAKHGNRALSSKCGSADVLEKLGININLKPKEVEDSISKKNFGFMFAPNYHSAMKHVAGVRKKISSRTIFNLIGPLSSPAKVKKQVVGVSDKKLLEVFSRALINLETTHAWIVHSKDGMDEISPFENTFVIEIKNQTQKKFEINPKNIIDFDQKEEDLIGKDANFNSNKIIDLFKGKLKDSFFNAVCLNAAAGLIVSNKISNFEEAFKLISSHVSNGSTYKHFLKIKNE